MKRQPHRVLVLMHEDRVPPEKPDQSSDLHDEAWKAEFHILKTLRSMGHEVLGLGVRDELRPIREAIGSFRPDIVFNLLDEFGGEGIFDQHVVAYLELLRVPYTGCNPRGMTLARDKALTKKILAYHRIPYPDFAVFTRGQKVRKPRHLTYPVIVKSLNEDASLGIAQASIVESDEKLQERVHFIHENIGTDALAESYIDGREIYVSVLGTDRLQVFPPWELVMDQLPEHSAPIATRKIKWDRAYQKRHKIRWGEAKLPESVIEKLRVLSRRSYRALHLSGYGRLDFRITEDGRCYVIEANPNPGIARDDEFPASAKAAKVSYESLLSRILGLGLASTGLQPVSPRQG